MPCLRMQGLSRISATSSVSNRHSYAVCGEELTEVERVTFNSCVGAAMCADCWSGWMTARQQSDRANNFACPSCGKDTLTLGRHGRDTSAETRVATSMVCTWAGCGRGPFWPTLYAKRYSITAQYISSQTPRASILSPSANPPASYHRIQ